MGPIFAAAILLGFCTFVAKASSTFELALEDYLRWKYTYFNENCTYVTGDRNPCQDIRICNFAVASQALGGWPTLCGWVHNKIPKVCCGLPLVLGPKLIKKTDEEKARKRECGTKLYSTRLSETENRFFEILQGLPPVETSNPDKFDPPLDLAEETIVSPVGGVPTRQGEFPWMVSIHKAGRHWCGGSLIDRIHVLSAAHCFVSERARIPDPNMYTVYVGNIHLDKGFPFRVQNISIHEKYITRLHYHDIALLTLSEEILSPVFAHICLPPPEFAAMDLSGRITTVLGWGHSEFGGTGTPILHVVEDIPVVSTEECKRIYSKAFDRSIPNGITEDFICAGLPKGGKDACQSDSGGPLMYKNNYQNLPFNHPDSPWILVGIASFGFLCGEPGYPGVYTRVSNYIDWIENKINV